MSLNRNLLLTACVRRGVGFGLLLGVLLLNGCAVERYFLEYRVNVQQGNVVEQKNIALLRPGMTRDQVRYVLGTPLLQDPFHASRWDYVYRYEDGASGKITMRNIFVYFNAAGQLERVGGDVAAAQPDDVQFTGDLTADAAAARNVANDARSNEPQVIDLGSLPEGAEGPPEGSEAPGDSWWWKFIHLFK
ncbi:MAG: outer membrane protein assembly factor BamE [Fluviibacter sp.]|jgi:outer membrane protein assembly factor BamE